MAIGTTAAIVGGVAAAGLGASAISQKRAADKAADAQREAAGLGIAEQRSQFQQTVDLLRPYTDAGAEAIEQQRAFLGLGDEGAAEAQIETLKASPQYQGLIESGEEAILQNAAATGGLRGGNVQNSLARYRTDVLNNLINQQYSRFAGLSTLGQAAGAQQAALGQTTGTNIANLYGNIGDATAQSRLAAGRATSDAFSGLGNIAGTIGGFGGF